MWTKIISSLLTNIWIYLLYFPDFLLLHAVILLSLLIILLLFEIIIFKSIPHFPQCFPFRHTTNKRKIPSCLNPHSMQHINYLLSRLIFTRPPGFYGQAPHSATNESTTFNPPSANLIKYYHFVTIKLNIIIW